MTVPVIDITGCTGSAFTAEAIEALASACEGPGFFLLRGHGVPPPLETGLERLTRRFFELPLENKLRLSMTRGGRAWRGYFPVAAN